MKISKESAPHYTWGNNCDGWYLLQDDKLNIIQECMPAHTSEKRHYHNTLSQFFFILKGQACIEVNGEEFVLSAKEGIKVMPLFPHQMKNDSNENLEFMIIASSDGKGDRVNVDINYLT